MDREPELKIIRRAFAKQVMAACGVLQAALADLADVITYRTEEYVKVAKRR
jgi:histone H3/H4